MTIAGSRGTTSHVAREPDAISQQDSLDEDRIRVAGCSGECIAVDRQHAETGALVEPEVANACSRRRDEQRRDAFFGALTSRMVDEPATQSPALLFGYYCEALDFQRVASARRN